MTVVQTTIAVPTQAILMMTLIFCWLKIFSRLQLKLIHLDLNWKTLMRLNVNRCLGSKDMLCLSMIPGKLISAFNYKLFYIRFEKQDIYRLRDALDVPAHYICIQGTKATGLEALMIMLRRLTYPNRWCDLQSVFGRSQSELCLIFSKVSFSKG